MKTAETDFIPARRQASTSSQAQQASLQEQQVQLVQVQVQQASPQGSKQ